MVSSCLVQVFMFISLPIYSLSSDSITCTSSSSAGAEDENSLLQGMVQHSRAPSSDGEVDFIVTRNRVFAGLPGLAYRVTMNFEDRDPDGLLTLWGSVLRGVPVGDNWLRVGNRYLPMSVQGHRVLERADSSSANDPYSNAASLTRTGQQQQPDDGEGNAEQDAPDQEVIQPEGVEQEATQADATEQEAVAPIAPEPEAFDGIVVQFGVLFKSFPKLDFLSGTFTTSLALTQRWPTNADAPADGENPWSPNLVVMNHDIAGIEAVSTSTIANQTDGMTTQVDYLIVRVRQTFDLENFPFDRQILSVRVAPASPGSVSMKLVPMHIQGERALEPGLLEDHGFDLVSVAEHGNADEDDNTLTAPARGTIEVVLDRRASAYFSSLFMPALLLLCLCWCVFFLPVPDPSFAVPRTAVPTGTFLAMLIFNLHVEQMVPARYGRMWIDVFTENIAILVFAGLAFNTLEQYVHSYMGRPLLASTLGFELRIFYPIFSAFILALCCFAPWSESLSMMSSQCRFSLAAGIFGYIGTAYRRALVGEEDKFRSPVVIRSPR